MPKANKSCSDTDCRIKSWWGLRIFLVFAHTLNSSGVVSMALAVIITLWKSLPHFPTCYLGCLPFKEIPFFVENIHAFLPLGCTRSAFVVRISICCCKYFVWHKQDTATISFQCHHWQMQSHFELGDICSAGLGDSQAWFMQLSIFAQGWGPEEWCWPSRHPTIQDVWYNLPNVHTYTNTNAH